MMYKDKVKFFDKDELADKYKEKTHIIKNSTYNNLIKMLFVNRIDYIVEYSPIITYGAKESEQENPTKSFLIQETQDNSKLKVVLKSKIMTGKEKLLIKLLDIYFNL